MKKLLTTAIRLSIGTVLFAVCGCRSLPQYSIQSNGTTISEVTHDGTLQTISLTSDLENPLIRGRVKLPRQRFEHVPSNPSLPDAIWGSCCSRVTLRLNGPFFSDRDTEKAVRLQPAPFRRFFDDGMKSYEFEAPPINLPEDGTPVAMMLVVDGDIKLTAVVTLYPDTLVIPVHFHVFAPMHGDLRRELSKEIFQGWIDPPAINTGITTRHSLVTGTTETDLITRRYPFANNVIAPDSVWSKAHIQFRFADYEVIRQSRQLEHELLSVAENATSVCEDRNIPFGQGHYLDNRTDKTGLHVYIGGTITVGGPAAGTTCGPNCTDRKSVV